MALLDVDDELDDKTTRFFLLFLCLSSTLCLCVPLCCLQGFLHLVEEELELSLDKDVAFLYWINILCSE